MVLVSFSLIAFGNAQNLCNPVCLLINITFYIRLLIFRIEPGLSYMVKDKCNVRDNGIAFILNVCIYFSLVNILYEDFNIS